LEVDLVSDVSLEHFHGIFHQSIRDPPIPLSGPFFYPIAQKGNIFRFGCLPKIETTLELREGYTPAAEGFTKYFFAVLGVKMNPPLAKITETIGELQN
jgi:hypothetical protein